MSAEATVLFLGIRMQMAEVDVPLLETKRHPMVAAARRAGLDSYWGDFAGDGGRYLLFVGKTLGVLGIENAKEFQVSDQDFAEIAREVRMKLGSVGIEGEPRLFAQRLPDI